MNAPHEERNDRSPAELEQVQEPLAPDRTATAGHENVPHPEQASTPPYGAERPPYGQPYPPPPAGTWPEPQRGGGWNRGSAAPSDSRRKSVTLATVLSFLPGLGQIYVGNYQRGFIHILVFASLITIVANGASGLAPLIGLSIGFFWFYNIIDAGRRASLYNQMLDAQAGGQLPSDFELPGGGGSVAGGIALMLIGVLFLMYTRFDFDMYWVEEWWPVGLIILGGYLFLKERLGSSESKDNKSSWRSRE